MVRKTELKETETAVYNALATVLNKLFEKKDGFNDYTMDS
nr:MAG TPA: hypothetical protein [Caudoviricetes sp.]